MVDVGINDEIATALHNRRWAAVDEKLTAIEIAKDGKTLERVGLNVLVIVTIHALVGFVAVDDDIREVAHAGLLEVHNDSFLKIRQVHTASVLLVWETQGRQTKVNGITPTVSC
jgi:hypothetical protein